MLIQDIKIVLKKIGQKFQIDIQFLKLTILFRYSFSLSTHQTGYKTPTRYE